MDVTATYTYIDIYLLSQRDPHFLARTLAFSRCLFMARAAVLRWSLALGGWRTDSIYLSSGLSIDLYMFRYMIIDK